MLKRRQRVQTFFQAIGTICLVVVAFENIRQTDIAKKDNGLLREISTFIDAHVTEETRHKNDAERFKKQLDKLTVNE